MDASLVFDSIIRSIEDSQLNYAISRTAFSASISIKCSFLKRFSENAQICDTQNMPRTNSQDVKKISELIEDKLKDVDAVVSFESFRALKLTLFESFRVLKYYDPIWVF